MKFPSSTGDVIMVHVDKRIARECYVASLRLESIRSEPKKPSKRAKGKEKA